MVVRKDSNRKRSLDGGSALLLPRPLATKMREHSEKYEVHIGTLNNNGTLNEISGSSVQLPDCGPGLPKIAQ